MTHPAPATDSRVLALAARCAQLEAALEYITGCHDGNWYGMGEVKHYQGLLELILGKARAALRSPAGLAGAPVAERDAAVAAWKLYQPLIDAAVTVLAPGHTVGDTKALQVAVTASRLALAEVRP